MLSLLPEIPIQKITHPILEAAGVSLSVKREDLIHPYVSGNKWRKLKYNLLEAEKQGCKRLVTFGGAFSNHIAAVSFAGKIFGFATVGIIRAEIENRSNPTLSKASENGMTLKFISRELYREKESSEFLDQINSEYKNAWIIPEGGDNEYGIKGCEEILADVKEAFEIITCCVGTGSTMTGMVNSTNTKILGFPALKNDGFLEKKISNTTKQSKTWELINDYHFGGYAKWNPALISFINAFYHTTLIPLDPIYTGKMFFGLFDMISKNNFAKGTKILAIHTGGLQGILGFNQRFGSIIDSPFLTAE